jgi:antitoxin ParD1/3/4
MPRPVKRDAGLALTQSLADYANHGTIQQIGDSTMPTRNVVITDRQAKLIDDLVESGEYQNASEVLREGIRLVEERRAERAAKLKALREAAQVGIDAMERGEYKVFTSAKSLNAHLDKIAAKAIARAKAR